MFYKSFTNEYILWDICQHVFLCQMSTMSNVKNVKCQQCQMSTMSNVKNVKYQECQECQMSRMSNVKNVKCQDLDIFLIR